MNKGTIAKILVLLMVIQVWFFVDLTRSYEWNPEGFFKNLCHIMSSLSPNEAHASNVTVFGPKKYIRTTGKPNVYQDTFSATAGTAQLIILSGEENGQSRVSSAIISLNGEQIFGTSDFNQNVYRLQKSIELSQMNTLMVELRSKPKSYLRIEIIATTSPDVLSVGPEGGTLHFPNGVILDIPAGAVTEETELEVTNVQCQQVDEILSAQVFPSHEIRCLGGFTGKPDGQVFLVPVTATIPVLPLKPGEKPIQIKVDLDKQKYHLAPTNLTYLGQEGMVVMEIREFSTNGVGALSTDESSGYTEPPPSCCFEYPTPFGCCCALGIEAVSDFSGLFTSSSGPGGSTDCSIVGMTVTVTFPLCPGSPQETSWVQETTGDCPEDMICRIEVNPSVTNLFVCKEQKLTASVNCEDEDGKSVQFTNSKFEPFWGIDNPYAGTIDPRTGTVRGLKEGLAQVEATWAIPDEHFIPGQSVVNVRSNIRSFSVSPSQATIKVGNGRILQVEIVGAEGNLLDPSNISWSSSDPSKAYVAFGTGGWTSVEGVDCGTVIITARYQYDCETVETTATIKVVKPNVSVMPASACIVIGDTILLTANVTDDCYGNPITDCTVVWPPNSSGVVVVNPSGLVTGIAEGQADVSAVCDDRIGFATIKVVKPSVTVTPGQPTIRVCDTIQLTATVTACPGTPYTGCTLTWYSSNTDVAVVDASGLVTAKHGGQANISAVCGDWIGVATVTVKGFTGVWDDSFGATLRITVDRTTGVAQGTYSGYWDFCGGTYHGAIEGQTSGHGCVLTGTWHDNFSAVQYGNDPWICFTGENGTFEFHLSPGGDSFTGSFIWLCVEGMGCRDDFGGGSWNGVRRVNP